VDISFLHLIAAAARKYIVVLHLAAHLPLPVAHLALPVAAQTHVHAAALTGLAYRSSLGVNQSAGRAVAGAVHHHRAPLLAVQLRAVNHPLVLLRVVNPAVYRPVRMTPAVPQGDVVCHLVTV